MKGVRFDPRTKIFLLVLCVLCTMFAPSLRYELVLVCLIGVFSILSGQLGYAFRGILLYGLIYAVTMVSITKMTGNTQAILVAFLGLVNKVYPFGLMGGLTIKTTIIGEFMTAFNKIHMPNGFVIPFAVMMRYLPVVREDWHYIKDAMRMRGISPSIKNICLRPMVVAECLYVPLMMAASNTADELSIAAVTRGIENPNPRTSLTEIRLLVRDVIAVIIFSGYLAMGLM
jgi:energy-coupling factor transporter transmembrane protein EcfT